jgi:hypothetical protein
MLTVYTKWETAVADIIRDMTSLAYTLPDN